MWRSIKQVATKTRINKKDIHRHYSSDVSPSKSKKVVFITATVGAGLAAAIVYSKYDAKLKNIFEKNIPYIGEIYKFLPDIKEPPKTSTADKVKPILSSSKEGKKIKESIEKTAEFNEKIVTDLMKQLESSCKEATSAYDDAFKALKKHVDLLYKALNGDYSNSDIWEQIYQAGNDRHTAMKKAEDKEYFTNTLVDKLKTNIQNVSQKDSKHRLVKMSEDTVEKVAIALDISKMKIKDIEEEAKSIQMQNDIAKQLASEEIRLNEVSGQQKLKDERAAETKIESKLEKSDIGMEIAVDKKKPLSKEDFDMELIRLLKLQTAAHLDHVKELLAMQEKELEQKFSLDLEEKLLHMKGVVTSEMSDSIARLNKILIFMRSKKELDAESKKAQLLWLSCQSLSEKLISDAGKLNPLGAEVDLIKLAADNAFVNTVLATIPNDALTRGVCSPEIIKQRFLDVKKVCRKVALINENNDSLYHYVLSHLQSYFVVDAVAIPKAELEGKVAVNPSEWDTFDVLSRVSYSLKTDDLEQALRYANQLKGEAKTVAHDWVKELRLFLETQTAIKALSAYAAAINVQAYH